MRRLAVLIGFVAVAGLAATAVRAGDCTCPANEKAGMGWCGHCHEGLAYGMTVKSQKVYDTIAGAKAPAAKEMKCKGCADAAAKDGTCEQCHVSFAHGKMYHSAAAHDLAGGMKVDSKDDKCEECKKLVASGKDGYCSKCNAGLVHGMVYKGKASYEKAEKAYAVVKTAVAAKCEGCGAAMLTDGKCATCKVSYKDGKAVKS